MPLYEYTCADCGQRFEELVSANGEKKPVCPSCGSTACQRMMSAFAPSTGTASARPSRRSGRGGCGGVGFS